MIEFRFLLDFHKPSNDSFYRWIQKSKFAIEIEPVHQSELRRLFSSRSVNVTVTATIDTLSCTIQL